MGCRSPPGDRTASLVRLDESEGMLPVCDFLGTDFRFQGGAAYFPRAASTITRMPAFTALRAGAATLPPRSESPATGTAFRAQFYILHTPCVKMCRPPVAVMCGTCRDRLRRHQRMCLLVFGFAANVKGCCRGLVHPPDSALQGFDSRRLHHSLGR